MYIIIFINFNINFLTAALLATPCLRPCLKMIHFKSIIYHFTYIIRQCTTNVIMWSKISKINVTLICSNFPYITTITIFPKSHEHCHADLRYITHFSDSIPFNITTLPFTYLSILICTSRSLSNFVRFLWNVILLFTLLKVNVR